MAAVCPVVGTTNTVLPPSHPSFDASIPGQVCPITNASTDHHHNLSAHPAIPSNSTINNTDSSSCPALKDLSSEPAELDESVCPVVGPATTVLPPGHPSAEDSEPGKECPKTKATFRHHKGKVTVHPSVEGAGKGAVCPVTGQGAVA